MHSEDKTAKKKRQIELKTRSKNYRDTQQSILNELKDVLGNKDLTTNQILSLSSSVLKLNELFTKNQQLPSISEHEELFTDDCTEFNKSKALQPVELDGILNACNLFGICISESGYILYESVSNPVPHFGFPDQTLVGNHIKRLLYDHEAILDQLFNHNGHEVVCQLRRYRNSYRRMRNFSIFKGRKYSTNKGAIFLGYFKQVQTISVEPTSLFQTCEILFWFDESRYLTNRPRSIDLLIGKECKSKDVTEDIALSTVNRAPYAIQSLMTFGKATFVMEFLCTDQQLLIVHSDNFIHPKNQNLVIGFVSPIAKIPAIGFEDVSASSEYLEMVNISTSASKFDINHDKQKLPNERKSS